MKTAAHLHSALREAGQEHAWERLEHLAPPARARLEAQLARLDFTLLRRLARLLHAEPSASPRAFEPPEIFPLRPTGAQAECARQARDVGEELLRAGRVGYVLVAG